MDPSPGLGCFFVSGCLPLGDGSTCVQGTVSAAGPDRVQPLRFMWEHVACILGSAAEGEAWLCPPCSQEKSAQSESVWIAALAQFIYFIFLIFQWWLTYDIVLVSVAQ